MAWTRPGSSARAMSLTEVLPTEPVTPTTRAPSARRWPAPAPAAPPADRRPRTPSVAELSASGALPRRCGERSACSGRATRPRRRLRSPRRRTRRRRGSRRGGRRRGRRGRSRRRRSSPAAAARPRPRPATRAPVAAAISLAGSALTRRSAAPASRRSSSRATSRSSKWILRPPSNSWPCSCPLPAITTVSPGSARASASAIAARRSTSTSTSAASPARPGGDFGDDRRRLLGARVVGGDDGEVGELAAGPAHLRPLVAVAVAAGAEDRDQPALAVSRRAARSTFSIESGVCA